MLEVKHLTVRSKEGRPLVRDVSFTLTPGEPLGLTGASGSGKTTIIKAVMGILPYGGVIEAGEILLDGLSLEKLPARERRKYCGTVLGFIPQSPMTAFDPHMKIGAQMVQTFRLRLNLPKDKALTLAREQLLAVNLEDVERILNSFPSQLSGGMLQRVSMACLGGLAPRYILADEPTSALDEENRDHLLTLLREIYHSAGILFVSHDVSALKMLCRETVMDAGICSCRGNPERGRLVMEGFVVDQVSKTYMDEKQRPYQVLHDVSFSWSAGENIAVLGESGSGKSTLARLLIGIEKPNSGTITWNGEDITRWKASTWREKRSHIQAVFQDASGTLNPARSVYHNVEEALRNLTQLDKRQRRARIDELMELTHMDSHLLQIPVRQLSGGEQRRLSLLRALSIHPQFLVLDEVTSGLDLLSADAVLQVLERYHEEFGCAYLLITHDRQTAYRISSRILELNQGVFVREAVRTESK